MITLPANAKYYSFVDKTSAYNSAFDITWSFVYQVSGSESVQHGVATFLTYDFDRVSVFPVLSGNGRFLSTQPKSLEAVDIIEYRDPSPNFNTPYNIFTIAIDSTGLFALSGNSDNGFRKGVSESEVIPNALVVRTYDDTVVCNIPLPEDFSIINNVNVIRCNYSNIKRTLDVQYRNYNSTAFSNGIHPDNRTKFSCPLGVNPPGNNSSSSSRGEKTLPAFWADTVLPFQLHYFASLCLHFSLFLSPFL